MSVQHDHTPTLQLVDSFRAQSATYEQQWANWLRLGSAGGVVALLSFAANLPDPDYALHALVPALTAFTIGLIAAAPNLLFAAQQASAAESHFASAANRDQLKDVIERIPEAIASPQSMADRMNVGRNKLIQEHDDYHRQAEAAWARRMGWRWAARVTTTIASVAFVIGVAAPLSIVVSGQKLVPATAKNAQAAG